MSLAILYQPTLVKIKSTMNSVLKAENNKLNGNLFFYYAMIINIFDYKLKIGNISFLKICNSSHPLVLGFHMVAALPNFRGRPKNFRPK